MAKGLKIASNHYNRVEAIKDFMEVVAYAREHKYTEPVVDYWPPVGAGWKTIDKHTKRLRVALEKQGLNPPAPPTDTTEER